MSTVCFWLVLVAGGRIQKFQIRNNEDIVCSRFPPRGDFGLISVVIITHMTLSPDLSILGFTEVSEKEEPVGSSDFFMRHSTRKLPFGYHRW